MIAREQQYDLKELAHALSPSAYLKDIGFRLFNWQEQVVSCPGKRIILLCSRQAGKSTSVSSVPCHSAKYYPKSLNLVMAPTEDQAVEDMIKVKDFIAHDPTYPDLKRDGADIIELDNGSRIIVVVATDRAARGYSRPRTIMVDEASRMPDVVYKSGIIPMLNHSPESRLYVLSTPFGQTGFFYEIWTRPTRTWTKIFVRTPWDTDPSDPLHLHPARPEKDFRNWCWQDGVYGYYSANHRDLAEQEAILEEIGIMQYQQEFCCDFVEMNGQVFGNEDMQRFFTNRVEPMERHDDVSLSASGALVPKSIGGRFF